jgi:hypothetical protein
MFIEISAFSANFSWVIPKIVRFFLIFADKTLRNIDQRIPGLEDGRKPRPLLNLLPDYGNRRRDAG